MWSSVCLCGLSHEHSRPAVTDPIRMPLGRVTWWSLAPGMPPSLLTLWILLCSLAWLSKYLTHIFS